MDPLKRMALSRDDWKEKARERADALREGRKAHKRQKQKIAALEEELTALKKRLEPRE